MYGIQRSDGLCRGSRNDTRPGCELSSTSSVSPTIGWPRSSTSSIDSPFRRIPSARSSPLCQMVIGNFFPVLSQPCHIFDARTPDTTAQKEVASFENRLRMPQRRHLFRKVQKLFLFRIQVPVDPADLIVLAIWIVVALLSLFDFVAAANHGHALRQQQRCKQILALLQTQALNFRIGRFAFDAAVPVVVVVVAVAVFLQIGEVTFFVIRDQIPQTKSVVGRDKVDTGVRLSSVVLIQIAAAGQTRGDFGDQSTIARPESTNRIAIASVPFRPQMRKVADLIATAAQVPRFRNQFDLRQNRILQDDVKKCTQLIDVMQFASQRLARSKRKPSTCIS